MSKLRKLVGASASLILVLGMIWAVVYRSDIIDQFRVWQYQPSGEISNLANKASFSERGKYYFYIARPRLEQAADFNEECRRAEPASALLGCYKPATETIHIYDVDDNAGLDGVEEVTAAHEMLHVAYSRLNQSERDRLTPLLEATYEKVKNDKFEERMAYYERAQPGSRDDELHSILATEYADIGSELENYFSQYFVNRSQVVSLYSSYHQKFDDNEQKADELSQQLESQHQQISEATEQYQQDMMVYNQDVTSFNESAKNGKFTSQTEFATQRSLLQARGQQLIQQKNNILTQIEAYNTSVEQLNSLGREQQRLNNSLDSMKAVE